MDKHQKRIQIDEDTNFVLSNMTEGVLVVDNQKNIQMINKSGLTYLNVVTSDPIGLKIGKAIKDENFQSYINELIESNTAQKREIRIKKKMDRFFLVNGTILQGPQSGYLVVLSDITKLKQLEKIRQDFVANVSHELKTPITSIIGYLELIDQGELKDEQKKLFLNKVFNHTNRMNAIIDDLLKLSKIESQEDDNSIELMPTPLSQIIDGSVDDLNTLTSKNNNKILVVCNESIMVNADPQLLREAIINLLENAVKYGTTGTDIKINVDQTETTNIQVINHGEVIPDKYRDRIFQRFYRIDKSRDREAGGTGLGLAIVKHISLVHGGEVGVSFSDNSETCFTISLPIL